MTSLETPIDTPGGRDADEAIPAAKVIGAGTCIAAILALAVSAQTYLSMLGHGHAFRRILLWQLISWSFWGLVAPLVLRRGAALAARRRRAWRDLLASIAWGAVFMGIHSVVAAQLAIWFQPFVPVVMFDFRRALMSQLPSLFAIDLLIYALLLVGGGALSAQHRAQRLELRESRLEAELARAQLHALRLEIEPHFLFNSLNTIAALIRLKDHVRALDMLVGLGEFLRSNLDHPRAQWVPLSMEIDWVKRYVTLQQTRFGDRLEVDYQIDASCADATVPTLLLQPIVENALRHGAARQTQRCRIVIGASMAHYRLRLWVEDDGAGLPPGFDLDRQAGTGLRNIRSRLELFYGRSATLQVRRGEPAGTRVEIVMPVTPAIRDRRATA